MTALQWPGLSPPCTDAEAVAFMRQRGDIAIGEKLEPDPMLDAVNGCRAWRASYAAASFGGSDDETAWIEANPDPAGDRLHGEPPMPTTHIGALAGIRFVMEDAGYIQAPHAAILKQALTFLEGGETAADLADTIAAAVKCGPTNAPAVGPDRFLAAMRRFNAEVAAYNTSGDDFENDHDGKTYGAISDRLFSEPDRSPPPITSKAGALLALDRIIELEKPFCDGEADALACHLRAYLDQGDAGHCSLQPPGPATDPFVERMQRYLAEVAMFRGNDGDGEEPGTPFAEELVSGACRVSSTAGAAMALRQVLAEDCIIDSFDQKLVESTLAFLEGGAPPAVSAPDPLLSLIAEYRRQKATYDAAPVDRSDAEEDVLFAATLKPVFERLRNNPPVATTQAGALAAFRLVADEDAISPDWNAASSVLAAGRAYFEGRASA